VEEREEKGSSGRDRVTLEESLLSKAQGSIGVFWAKDFNENRGTKTYRKPCKGRNAYTPSE